MSILCSLLTLILIASHPEAPHALSAQATLTKQILSNEILRLFIATLAAQSGESRNNFLIRKIVKNY